MRLFTAEYPKKVNGCEFSRPNTPKKPTDATFHGRIPQKSQRMRLFTVEYPKKVNGCDFSQPDTPKKSADEDFHSQIPRKSQRMRIFTVEYPEKVSGCDFSQPNTPKRSPFEDFHSRTPRNGHHLRTFKKRKNKTSGFLMLQSSESHLLIMTSLQSHPFQSEWLRLADEAASPAYA